jgi:hypothetical protein
MRFTDYYAKASCTTGRANFINGVGHNTIIAFSTETVQRTSLGRMVVKRRLRPLRARQLKSLWLRCRNQVQRSSCGGCQRGF